MGPAGRLIAPCRTGRRPGRRIGGHAESAVRAGTRLRCVTATLRTSHSAAREVSADAIVVAVSQGPDGPVLAAGADDVDAALGGTLIETLTALGATGKAEEVTRTVSGGKLAAPVIAAVGIGRAADRDPGSADAEILRRSAGAAVRSLASPKVRSIALALPAGDAVSAEAAALGALLGSYYFGRYRSNGHPAAELTLLASGEHVGWRGQPAPRCSARPSAWCATWSTPARRTCTPRSSPPRPSKIAAEAGLGLEILDETALTRRRLRRDHRRRAGLGSPAAAGAAQLPAPGGVPRRSCSPARGSRSTPAGCRSSRRRPWRP